MGPNQNDLSEEAYPLVLSLLSWQNVDSEEIISTKVSS